MMKVLLVANVAKEHVLKFHLPTINEMKRRGWSVDVACAGDEDVPGCDEQFRMTWKRSPFTKTTLGEIARLRRIISQGNYDLIYCHTPMGGLASRLAFAPVRKSGATVIYCVHGFHFFRNAPMLNWLVYYPAERFLAHYTDVIITVNKEDFEFASNHFPKRLKVYLIPGMGADMSRIRVENRAEARKECRSELAIPEDALAMIYVAELTDNKNQKMLIDALGRLREKGNDAYLILAGPDHIDGRYEEYARKCGLEDRCRFLGWRDDIGRLLAAADVYTASSIREGMTINVIEARMAMLPVVATDNRGRRMAMEGCDEGALVEIGDVDAMVDSILELKSNNTHMSEMDDSFLSEKRKELEHYDADMIAIRVVDILEEETR